MTEYRAPYDSTVRSTTIAVSAILTGVIVLMLVLMVSIDIPLMRVFFAALAGGIFMIPALSYRFAPTGYVLEPHRLIVHRPAGPLMFPLERPLEARRQDRLGFTLRTGGNGGLFGAYGNFRNKDLGSFKVYARRGHDYVIISTPSLTLVVGPENPDQFVSEITAQPS